LYLDLRKLIEQFRSLKNMQNIIKSSFDISKHYESNTKYNYEFGQSLIIFNLDNFTFFLDIKNCTDNNVLS